MVKLINIVIRSLLYLFLIWADMKCPWPLDVVPVSGQHETESAEDAAAETVDSESDTTKVESTEKSASVASDDDDDDDDDTDDVIDLTHHKSDADDPVKEKRDDEDDKDKDDDDDDNDESDSLSDLYPGGLSSFSGVTWYNMILWYSFMFQNLTEKSALYLKQPETRKWNTEHVYLWHS